MKEFTVSKNESGQRLDKFLIKYLKNASSGFIYKMLRKKNILLNGSKANGPEILNINDQIKFYLSDETFLKMKGNHENKSYIITNEDADNFKNSIIYEDPNILIINKPYGILSQSADLNTPSAVELLINYMLSGNKIDKRQLETFRPSFCNRLDRNTSGILIAGKTLEALQLLNLLFKNRMIEKYYYALVFGKFTENLKISAYLKKDESTNKVIVSDKESENSVYIENEFSPVKFIQNDTLIKIHLITGKTHQIRAHLAHLGHPVIGDAKYGIDTVNHSYKSNKGVKYQLLHAGEIIFPQNISGSLSYLSGKRFTAIPPDVFQNIIESD